MKYQIVAIWSMGLMILLQSCQSPNSSSLYFTPSMTDNPVELVNPLIGTDSDFSLSNSITYPAMISDAYITWISGFDAQALYEALLKNALIGDGRPVNSVGRVGVEYYNKLGYVPYDVGINENPAWSLEYAYADFDAFVISALDNQKKNVYIANSTLNSISF